jgi:hypothetical protein
MGREITRSFNEKHTDHITRQDTRPKWHASTAGTLAYFQQFMLSAWCRLNVKSNGLCNPCNAVCLFVGTYNSLVYIADPYQNNLLPSYIIFSSCFPTTTPFGYVGYLHTGKWFRSFSSFFFADFWLHCRAVPVWMSSVWTIHLLTQPPTRYFPIFMSRLGLTFCSRWLAIDFDLALIVSCPIRHLYSGWFFSLYSSLSDSSLASLHASLSVGAGTGSSKCRNAGLVFPQILLNLPVSGVLFT